MGESKSVKLILTAIAACGLCCALPILIGAGLLPTAAIVFGTYFESFALGLFVFIVGFVIYKKLRLKKETCKILKK